MWKFSALRNFFACGAIFPHRRPYFPGISGVEKTHSYQISKKIWNFQARVYNPCCCPAAPLRSALHKKGMRSMNGVRAGREGGKGVILEIATFTSDLGQF